MGRLHTALLYTLRSHSIVMASVLITYKVSKLSSFIICSCGMCDTARMEKISVWKCRRILARWAASWRLTWNCKLLPLHVQLRGSYSYARSSAWDSHLWHFQAFVGFILLGFSQATATIATFDYADGSVLWSAQAGHLKWQSQWLIAMSIWEFATDNSCCNTIAIGTVLWKFQELSW